MKLSQMYANNLCSGMLLLLVLLVISCNVPNATAQNWQSWLSCQTLAGTQGRCVHYRDCIYAAEFERNYGNNLPDNVREFLTNSRCDGADRTKFNICCDLTYIQPTANAIQPVPMTASAPTSRPSPTQRPTRGTSMANTDTEALDSSVIFTSNRGNFEGTLNRRAVEILNGFTCGVTNTNRVSNANKTVVGEFPWMALLRYDNPNQPFQCGGSLISARFIISAAHCMVDTNDDLIGVRLGEHTINSDEDCRTFGSMRQCYRPQDFGIDRVIPHPKYNLRRQLNDIGLIRLDRDAKFEGIVAPICLPLTNKAAQLSQYPRNFILAGWGTTEKDTPSNELLKANISPHTRTYCQEIFRRASITMAHLCAGGENQVDSCKGDSGGPLFASTLYGLTARYVIYGVVSFGVAKCGDVNSYPGVYTNVVQFMPWITDQIAS